MTKHFKQTMPFTAPAVLDGLRDLFRKVPAAEWPPSVVAFGRWLTERIADDDTLVTLAQARDFVRAQASEGCRCPCCTQTAKLYKRPLTAEMAEYLVQLVMYYVQHHDWAAPTAITTRGGDYAKLAHWGLIEFKDATAGVGHRTGGPVRPTKRGVAFAMSKMKVQSHVLLFANKRLGFEGPEISIRDVPKFNYAEIMQGFKATLPPAVYTETVEEVLA